MASKQTVKTVVKIRRPKKGKKANVKRKCPLCGK